MAEAIGRFLAKGIKVAVAYINIFAIIDMDTEILLAHLLMIRRQIDEVMGSGIIIVIKAPGVRQLAGRVGSAIQDLHQCIACTHTCKAGINHCIDAELLHPAHFNGITGVDNGNCFGECLADRTDHRPLVV